MNNEWSLKCNNETKLCLERLKLICTNEGSVTYTPHIFLYTDKGAGACDFFKAYSKIIIEYSNNICKKEACFLECKYPFGMEITEVHRKFFESPVKYARDKMVANYEGVFVTNLQEWVDIPYLEENKVFNILLNFIVDNPYKKMKFGFVMPTKVKDTSVETLLKRALPIMETMYLRAPDSKTCMDYIKVRLEHKGIFFDKKATKELQKCCDHMVALDNFEGFDTLDKVAERLIYECYKSGCLELCISEKIVNDTLMRYEIQEYAIEKSTIGFQK